LDASPTLGHPPRQRGVSISPGRHRHHTWDDPHDHAPSTDQGVAIKRSMFTSGAGRVAEPTVIIIDDCARVGRELRHHLGPSVPLPGARSPEALAGAGGRPRRLAMTPIAPSSTSKAALRPASGTAVARPNWAVQAAPVMVGTVVRRSSLWWPPRRPSSVVPVHPAGTGTQRARADPAALGRHGLAPRAARPHRGERRLPGGGSGLVRPDL
jgi:hypothetical protein